MGSWEENENQSRKRRKRALKPEQIMRKTKFQAEQIFFLSVHLAEQRASPVGQQQQMRAFPGAKKNMSAFPVGTESRPFSDYRSFRNFFSSKLAH